MVYRILTFEEFCEKLENREVKHSIDTSGTFPSWIEYWEQTKKRTRDSLKKCPCCGRDVPKDDLYWVGAHVEDEDGNYYITPTCNSCNSKYKESKADEKWFEVNINNLCPPPQQTQEY